MDSGSKDQTMVEDDGDTATKYVLDYYKKYSQNKYLPKYFSGTSIFYLPEIKHDEFPEVTVKTDVNIVITSPDTIKKPENAEKSLDTSRASSAMSNRKLEWDNGADIGYNNCQDIKILRKSISLPVITDLEQNKLGFDIRQIMSNIDQVKSEGSSDSNFKIVVLTYSSSSECPSPNTNKSYSSSSSPAPEEKKNLPSSSSNTDVQALSKDNGAISLSSDSSSKEKIANFATSLSYLKKKIGLPDAHSTPKYLEARKSDPELYSSTNLVIKPETKEDKCDGKPSVSKSDELLQQVGYKGIDKSSKLSGQSMKKVKENVQVAAHKGGPKNFSDNSKGRLIAYKNNKILNLAVSKPITVECTSNTPRPKNTLQTKCTTVGVQTDDISRKELHRVIQTTEGTTGDAQNQCLIYFEFSETDKTCSTQTSSDLVSNCDSFEYIKNSSEPKNGVPSSDISSKNKSVSKSTDNVVLANETQEKPENLVHSQKTVDLRTVTSEENSHQSTSKDFCLANVISASQLDTFDDDVEKNISLLHKLIKSKKYDSATKKRYIKKIMQKITESKYMEESSTSSELFLPKKSKLVSVKPSKPVSTDTSDEKLQKSALQTNLPWYPATSERMKLSPRRKKLGFKTFAQDFLPKHDQPSPDETHNPQEIIPVDLRDTKKNCFTLTNNEFCVNRDYLKQEKKEFTQIKASSYETDNTSLEKQYDSSSTPKSPDYQNWREDKTISEKLLEQKTHGDGDCLVKFAEKERAYQINWINSEISHLGKLKCLLEKPLDFPNVNKTTTVYTVSEERDHSDKKEIRFKRNYVIETHLGPECTAPVSFKLDGKKYTVSEGTSKKTHSSKKARQVVGDIEVTTSDSTTSIKISTFCDSCRRSPCTCVCPKCKKLPCICYMLKSHVCRTCHTIPCICPCTSSGKHHKNCLLDQNFCWKCNKFPCECARPPSTISTLSGKTICLLCHRSPCICKKRCSGRGMLSKTCLSCGQYPCIRGKSRTSTVSSVADEYTGAFIPALCPKPSVGGEDQQKFATFPYTSKEEYGRKISIKCPVCEKCSCNCESLKDVRTQGTSISIKLIEKSPSKKCSICGKCSCSCETTKTTTKSPSKCPICLKCPCICDTTKKDFYTQGTSVSTKSLEKCLVCGKCPCTCASLDSSNDSIEKCPICGKCACICETIKKDFHTKGTSISIKSLEMCPICKKCPCICEVNKKGFHTKGTSVSTKSLGVCSICGECPCICKTPESSNDSLEKCPVCGKCSCICEIEKEYHTQGTLVSVKSQEVCSVCGKCPCICETLKTALSVKEMPEKGNGSLKKVFENCNCTQNNCNCDFVEKLLQRFNKVDILSSIHPRNNFVSKSLQTDTFLDSCSCQHVGIQTYALSDIETKISQTEKCCQNVGIQTQTETKHQVLQTYNNCCDAEQQSSPLKQITFEDGQAQVEFVNAAAKQQSTKCTCFSKQNVNVECTCGSQGTQTHGEKKVVVTFSSQSDGSSPCSTTAPLECACNRTQAAGISHVKKPGKVQSAVNKFCICSNRGSSKRQPRTIITEKYASKTESLESDTRYVTSSKSSSMVTSSYNGTESVSEPSSLITCVCCKEKYPAENISMLGSANQNIPLCVHCLQRKPILTSLCYAGPKHVCTCYKPRQGDILHGIKKTVDELYDLEEYCSCTKPSPSKNSRYCAYCQLKLKSTARTKNGIAYTLTLEDETPRKIKYKRKRKQPSLEEIRVKVPCPYGRKEHKNKLNLSKQDGDSENIHTVGYMERIVTDSDKKTPRVKVICSKSKRNRRPNLTLQEYLRKNRPDFIDTAEYRRHALVTSRSERELNKEEVKLRLLEGNKCRCNMYLEDNKCKCRKPKNQHNKLFTEREMKAITRRNYAKLPEVQQKNNELREQRLKNADKFIVDVFSTKIRNCALKGKKDFPLSQNIVSLPKA